MFRPEGWPANAIMVKGDKSFLSRFLRIPTMLVDDKEENADIHKEGHPMNQQVICKRGRKYHHTRMEGYIYRVGPSQWFQLYEEFYERRRRHINS